MKIAFLHLPQRKINPKTDHTERERSYIFIFKALDVFVWIFVFLNKLQFNKRKLEGETDRKSNCKLLYVLYIIMCYILCPTMLKGYTCRLDSFISTSFGSGFPDTITDSTTSYLFFVLQFHFLLPKGTQNRKTQNSGLRTYQVTC
jgi:hypothetical protein